MSAKSEKAQPLPVGLAEFHEWSDRIIKKVNLPDVPADSLKFVLANNIMHLGPTECEKEDSYFVKSIRKSAANQVASQVFQEIKQRQQEALKAEEKQKAEATANEVVANAKETQN